MQFYIIVDSIYIILQSSNYFFEIETSPKKKIYSFSPNPAFLTKKRITSEFGTLKLNLLNFNNITKKFLLIARSTILREEDNDQDVRYLIREWKGLCPFSLYLPTNLAAVALDKVQVIKVATVPSSALTFTKKKIGSMKAQNHIPIYCGLLYRKYLDYHFLVTMS